MNFYKQVSIFTGAFLIPILPAVGSAWAGVEQQSQPADPKSIAAATPDPATPLSDTTPIQLVKRLAIDTIHQSNLVIETGHSIANPVNPFVQQRPVASARTQVAPASMPQPSRVLANCPTHVCPPVNALIFPRVVESEAQPNKGFTAVQQPQKGNANSLLPSPSVSQSSSVTLNQLGVSNAADILREHASAQQPLPSGAATAPINQPPIFSSDGVLNLVDNLTKNLEVNNISQQFSGMKISGMKTGLANNSQQLMIGIDQNWHRDESLQGVLIDRTGLYLPISSAPLPRMKVNPDLGSRFNSRLTLGGDELDSVRVGRASSRNGQFESFFLTVLPTPQPETFMTSLGIYPNRL